jgi:hypothetical protein
MRIIVKLILVLSLLSYSLTESATQRQAQSPSATSAAAASASPRDVALKLEAEITLLREQNKLIREFQNSILDTVFWALAGVVTIAIALAVFGWWSNFKVYENDKRRLQDDLNARMNELGASLLLKFESGRGDLERAIESKNAAFLNKLLLDTSEIRAEVGTLRTEVSSQQTNLRVAIEDVTKALQQAKQTDLLTMVYLRQAEEYIWELKNIPSNILITQSQALEAANDAQLPSQIKSILDRMKSTIQKFYVAKNASLGENARKILETEISLAAKTNPIEAAEVIEMLRKVSPNPAAPQ